MPRNHHTDAQLIDSLATEYETGPVDVSSYRAAGELTVSIALGLLKTGRSFYPVHDEQPGLHLIRDRRVIPVATSYLDHPGFTPEQFFAYRFVHDITGHGVSAGFDWKGELEAFKQQARWYPQSAHPVLFAQIAGYVALYFARGQQFGEFRPVVINPDVWTKE